MSGQCNRLQDVVNTIIHGSQRKGAGKVLLFNRVAGIVLLTGDFPSP